MAEQLDKPEGEGKRRRAAHGEPGHNIGALRTKAEPLFKQLDKLFKDKADAAGGYQSDINDKYQVASKATGVPIATLKREYKRMVSRRREAEEEMQMDAPEREQIEAMRDALGDTPLFGHYVAGKLAKGPAA